MHSMYLLLLPKKDYETAEAAADSAEQVLIDQNFNNQDGYWGGGMCDWFSVGGRWCHFVTMSKLPKDEVEKFEQIYYETAEYKKGDMPAATAFDTKFLNFCNTHYYKEPVDGFNLDEYDEFDTSEEKTKEWAKSEKYWVVVIDYHF